MFRRVLKSLIWVSILLVVFSINGLSLHGEQAGLYTEVFTLATGFDYSSADPAGCSDETMQLLLLCYDRLVEEAYVDGELKIVPMLAKAWEVTENGMGLILHLRKGVNFDDGTPCDASAAQLSLQRTKEIKLGRSYDWLKNVEVLDAYTVKLELSYKYAPALAILTYVTSAIINPTAIREHMNEGDWGHDWFDIYTDGSGPFKLARWEPGGNTVLIRKEHNWRDSLTEEDFKDNPRLNTGDGNIKKAVYRYVPEAATMMMLLGKGGVDAAKGVSAVISGPIVEENPKIERLSGFGTQHRFVFINCSKTPLNDLNLRKALAYAVDREAICKEIVPSESPKGHLWLHDMWPECPEEYHYHYDLAKAEEYLAKSEYDGETLRFRGFPYSDFEAVASVLVAEWTAIGVDVEWKGIPWSILWGDEIVENKADLVMFAGWPDFLDPDAQAIRLWSKYIPPNGFNVARYVNEEYDELFMAGRTTYNKEKRIAIYEEIQKIIFDDCPVVWISQLTNARNIQGTWIKNTRLIPGEIYTWNIEQIRKVPSEMP